MKTRFIQFAGSTVAIQYHGSRARHIVHFLFESAMSISPISEHASAHKTFSLLRDVTGTLNLYEDDSLYYQCQSDGEMAVHILDRVGYALADTSREGLLFHAAGMCHRGQGIMLPGPTGHGKSTLTAGLSMAGADYLTDELVYIPQGKLTFEAFPRPLSLKGHARKLIREKLDLTETEMLHSTTIDLVAQHTLNVHHTSTSTSLDVIVFPAYTPDSTLHLTELSKAQTGLWLMECLVNARNLPGHGFTDVVYLAQHIPAYWLRYPNFEEAVGGIEVLLSINANG